MEGILLKFAAMVKVEGALSVIGLSVAMGMVKTIAVLMGYVSYDTHRPKREIAWLVFWEVLGLILVTIPIAILTGLVTLNYTGGHEGKALLATAIFAIIGRSVMDTLIKLKFDRVMNAGLEGAANVLQKWSPRQQRDPYYDPYQRESHYNDNDSEYRNRDNESIDNDRESDSDGMPRN